MLSSRNPHKLSLELKLINLTLQIDRIVISIAIQSSEVIDYKSFDAEHNFFFVTPTTGFVNLVNWLKYDEYCN
jgi:hypothetical protein